MLEDQLKTLCDEIKTTTGTEIQVLYVDYNSADGAKIAEFYEIPPENYQW